MTPEELDRVELQIKSLRHTQGRISNVILDLESMVRAHYCKKAGEPCALVAEFGLITESELRSPAWRLFAAKHKLRAIKAVREMYGYSLSDAKLFVENGFQ